MTKVAKYRELMLRLFPRGRAWAKDQGTVFYSFAEALGVEYARIDDALAQLMEDADPRTTNQLITDWENLVGLPDECQDIAPDIETRREDVVRKLTNRGGSSREFFSELAQSIGYDATVTDCFPFRAGRNRCGDRMFGDLWRFWFQVSSPDFQLDVFRCGVGRCGDRLRTFRNDELECVIRRSAPAHTKVQFLYGS